jgi:peptide deformylase
MLRRMTIRKIAQIGHPVLRQRAREVGKEELASRAFQTLVDDLVETMRDANGAGLAAIQIYEPVRLVAVEVNENPRYPYKPKIPLTILVNPVIEALSEETFENYEGCLSVPNLRGIVKRTARIRITALDREGKPVAMDCNGFKAGTMQHEVDHLDGVIFVDRVKDPLTFSTWTEYDRHHREAFLKKAEAVVARYGS